MIKVYIYRNTNKEIFGFKVYDHGDSIVCAAVSALVINTANSIETLTDEALKYEYNEKGGYISLSLQKIESGGSNHDTKLLLDSMVLGLFSIYENNKRHIKIYDDL